MTSQETPVETRTPSEGSYVGSASIGPRHVRGVAELKNRDALVADVAIVVDGVEVSLEIYCHWADEQSEHWLGVTTLSTGGQTVAARSVGKLRDTMLTLDVTTEEPFELLGISGTKLVFSGDLSS
jgi:hypothetical protein